MWRLVLFLLAVMAAATGLAWLADRPGSLIVNWQGYEIETSVFRAVVILGLLLGLAIMLWSLARQVWMSPAMLGNLINRRRHKRGLEAISTGMIAIGAGDRSLASRYAMQARKSLPNEPLTHLLRAQAAQLSGDRATARRIFEAMLASPDTEQLGLRGLFLEAEREGEKEAARQFAERALGINPKLGWPIEALFDLQCRSGDWAGALETLAAARKHGHVDKQTGDRRRAVLLTAQAQPVEDGDPEKALSLALEAHGLAPDLVPAAAIAGRILASRGNTPRAAKVIQQTWKHTPHPDLATVYAYARVGDSPRDRLTRVKQLTVLYPNSAEGPIAVANAAIEAKDYDEARGALAGLLEGRLTQRVCLLMARIEGEQHGDKGRVREWLARAVNAPRDPAWTADGVVSEQWQPRSPVTGALDAFQWRVPVEQAEPRGAEMVAEKLEELVALGAPREVAGTTAPPAEAKSSGAAATASSGARPPAAPPAKPDPRSAEDAVVVGEAPAPKAEAVVKPGPKPAGEADAAEKPKAGPAADEPAPSATAAAKPKVEKTAKPAAPAAKPATLAVDPGAKSDPAPASNGMVAEPKKSLEASKPATKAEQPIAVAMPSEAKPAAELAKVGPAQPDGKPEIKAATAAQQARPTQPGNAKGALAGKTKLTAEPKIFVSPRAPDDPGPEPAEPDDLRSPLAPYRTSS